MWLSGEQVQESQEEDGVKEKEVGRGGCSLPGSQSCYSCSSWTGLAKWRLGNRQSWVAEQAGERTFPVCFTSTSHFCQEGR